MPSPAAPPLPAGPRRALALVVLAFTFLAVNSSVLTPLWEIPDENEHFDVVAHWARHGTMPNLVNLPLLGMNEGVQPPLAYWGFALGLRALGLHDVPMLSRQRFDAEWMAEGRQLFLHGPDEVFPFRGPARGLHLLRLFSVLAGIATVLGAAALGRRLLPGAPAAAPLTAALVAFNPSFLSMCSGISNDALALTLITWSLVLLADFVRDPAPTGGRCLRLGLVIGFAHLAKLSATFLIPAVALALLLRRPRGERWTASLLHLDWIVAGFLIPAGPYFAWNIHTYGDPFALQFLQEKFDIQRRVSLSTAIFAKFVPEIARTYVNHLSTSVRAGTPVLAAWALAVGTGLVGLVTAWRRRATAAAGPARVEWRVAALLGAGFAVNLGSALKFFLDFNQPQGRYVLPSVAAVAALVALGWLQLLRPALAAAGAAALGLITFHAQVHVLGPLSLVPNRVDDPHMMIFDPLAAVPPERRLDTLSILEPAEGTVLGEAPSLRWDLPDDPHTRYTVHLSTPGSTIKVRTYEKAGLSVRDRYTIPESDWNHLPPGMNIICQVFRLPTLDEALNPPPGGLFIEQSPPLVLRRGAAEAP